MSAGLLSLFESFDGAGLRLHNRFVMAPMSRYFSPQGVPEPAVIDYYRRRAEAGVSLIITEGAWIDDVAAANDDRVPCFYGEDALAQWRRVVDDVHGAGGKIVPQLWHTGAQKKLTDGPGRGIAPRSPSGLQGPGLLVGQPMTQRDIDNVIEAYGSAAATARTLGFDGLELHAGHGYLIDQFFWHGSNLRTDRYGGAGIGDRVRFGEEVVQECRRSVGPDFPILLRFSQWKIPDFDARLFHTPAELDVFLDRLAAAGVDMFHCSVRRYWDEAFEGSARTLAGWTRHLSGKPTITVGSVGLSEALSLQGSVAQPASLDRLVALYERGEFDLVAIGRMLIVEPRFVERIRDGRLEQLPAFTPSLIRTHFTETKGGPKELY